jgi:hypothetical protein
VNEEWQKNEGPGDWGCIAWILGIILIPALIGWGVSEGLSRVSWASRFSTTAGVVLGIVFLIVTVVVSYVYADKHGYLDVDDSEDNEL